MRVVKTAEKQSVANLKGVANYKGVITKFDKN